MAEDRFSDAELRRMLTDILIQIRAKPESTEAERAQIAADVRPRVEEAIIERNKRSGPWST